MSHICPFLDAWPTEQISSAVRSPAGYRAYLCFLFWLVERVLMGGGRSGGTKSILPCVCNCLANQSKWNKEDRLQTGNSSYFQNIYWSCCAQCSLTAMMWMGPWGWNIRSREAGKKTWMVENDNLVLENFHIIFGPHTWGPPEDPLLL